MLTVYIANVPVWLDEFDLWNVLSERVATVYLPHRKHLMLPSGFSTNLCSLIEGRTRFAFAMDVTVNLEGDLLSHEFCSTSIRVTRNYGYADIELEQSTIYQKTLSLVKQMNDKTKYLDRIDDSHGFIEFLMIHMNHICGKYLQSRKAGIFKSFAAMPRPIPPGLPGKAKSFLAAWGSAGSKYVHMEYLGPHRAIGVEVYTHITSPIRRIVDILNLSKIQDCTSIVAFRSSSYQQFHDSWMTTDKLEHINDATRRVKKVQSECGLLSTSLKDPAFFDRVYKGIVLDRKEVYDHIRYRVYLYEMGVSQQIYHKGPLEAYSMHNFKLYKFYDETKMVNKIRCALYID